MVNFFGNPSCGQYQHSKWQYYEETQHTGYYADQDPDRIQHPSTELVFRIELISFLAHSTDIIAQAQYLSTGYQFQYCSITFSNCWYASLKAS